MKKIFCALTFILLLAILTNATTVVRVLDPNGGEVLAGTYEVSWDYNDDASNQAVTFDLYYSQASGLKQFLISENIAFDDNCDTASSNQFNSDVLTDYNAGIPKPIGEPSDFDTWILSGELYLSVMTESSAAADDVNTWKWNTDTNNWDDETATFTWNMEFVVCDASDLGCGITIFELDSEHYALMSGAPPATKRGTYGFKLNGTTWEANSDINSGLSVASVTSAIFTMPRIHHLEINDTHYILMAATFIGAPLNRVYGFVWNGSSWVVYEPIRTIEGLDGLDELSGNSIYLYTGFSDYTENNETFLMGANAKTISGYRWAGASTGWTLDADANKGIDLLGEGDNWGIATPTMNNKIVALFARQVGKVNVNMDNGINHQMERGEFFDTLNSSKCTFDWNTTTAANGEWYLVVEGTGSSVIIDSSDTTFSLNNFDANDFEFTAISNIAGHSFGQYLEINPTDHEEDLIFSVKNVSGLSASLSFDIPNNIDDGRQYKVFVATTTDYAAGIWNFEDTITFGTTSDNAIQKLWDSNSGLYNYIFSDTILNEVTTYYKIELYSPAFHFHSLNDSTDWDNALTPDTVDFNGTNMDLFYTSIYANIDSTLTDPFFPAITSSSTAKNYVFQLTAKADVIGSGFLRAGEKADLLASISNITPFALDKNGTTFTKTDLEDGFLNIDSNSTTAKEIFAHNYAIIERGFFTKKLDVYDSDGSELPVILDGGLVAQYISEGKKFIVDTAYLNPDNKLDRVEVAAYIDIVADANRLKKWSFDAESESGIIQFRETIGGLVDLVANAPNRTVRLTVRLVDNNADYYEIQSKVLKLVQFPYFPGDFSINAFALNKQVAEHPAGQVIIRTVAPENLRGVNLYIYDDAGAPDRSDYNAQYVKDADFTCRGFDCSFDLDIQDWVFPDQDNYRLTVSALLTTQNEDYNSDLTAKTVYFRVFWKDFETARILETVERVDVITAAGHDYRNDEEIALVMQLRDSDLSNLKNDVQAKITLENCDAETAGNCIDIQDLNYLPASFLYDPKTGYNYFFWREVFINDDGTLLDDGNWYRIRGEVKDIAGSHETVIHPVLVPKCQVYPPGDCNSIYCFISNALASMNHYLNGCITASSAIVTAPDNNAQEIRLKIDAAKSLAAPTQECLFCLNVDENNLYQNNLEQDVICGSWYTFNEAPIDSFEFYLGNKNSDFSKTENNKQYLHFTVPYPLIAFNDLTLMQKSMELEYGTRADTIGELIWQVGNTIFTGIANPLVDIPEELVADGIIPNVGFDCNFSRAVDPTYIDGMVFFKLRGIKTLNKQDYIPDYPELENVDTKDFIEYLNYKGISHPDKETRIQVLVSDLTMIMDKEIASPLVIDAPFSENLIRRENVADDEVQFETIPTRLQFIVINDLLYNNERNTIRRYVPFTLTAIISPESINLLSSFGRGLSSLLTNPGLFLVQNWFLIFIAGIVLLFAAGIWSKFKGKGTTVIMQNSGGG